MKKLLMMLCTVAFACTLSGCDAILGEEDDEITFRFELQPAEGGDISGGGDLIADGSMPYWSITALPDPGYEFVHWQDGDTNADRKFYIPEDIEKLKSMAYEFDDGIYYIRMVATFRKEGSGEVDEPFVPVPGAFSVGETKQVFFSPGNLQYKKSANTWRFAEHQWDYIGYRYNNGNSDVVEINGWRDLFAWGTSGYDLSDSRCVPIDREIKGGVDSDHDVFGPLGAQNLTGENYIYDWGSNAIENGGNRHEQWRTPTIEEYRYLFEGRTHATSLFSWATVCDWVGMVILPDDWQLPEGIAFVPYSEGADYDSNVYTQPEWELLEEAGAVFLPSNGYYGQYWTASAMNAAAAYMLSFSEQLLDLGTGSMRGFLLSVRLVRDARQ